MALNPGGPGAGPADDREEDVDATRYRYTAGRSLITVLNDPSQGLTVSEWPFPNTLAPVPPQTYLPEYSIRDFEPYLKATAKPYKTFRKTNTKEKKLTIGNRSTAHFAQQKEDNARFLIAAKEIVPELFFRINFDLTRPETFRLALEGCDSSMKLTQERLSHFLDTVEFQLAGAISVQAEEFLGALSNIHLMHGQVASYVATIERLRKQLSAADKSLYVLPAQVSRAERRKENVNKLQALVKEVAMVRETQPTIQKLLASGDYTSALDLIEHTQNLLSTRLVGIVSLRHLSQQLSALGELIEKMMSSDAGALLDAVKRADTDTWVVPSVQAGALRDSLFPFIHGLVRLGKLSGVFQKLQQILIGAGKHAITQILSRSAQTSERPVTTDEEGKSATLNSYLREMNTEPFLQLLLQIFVSLTSFLEFGATTRTAVMEIVRTLVPPAEIPAPVGEEPPRLGETVGVSVGAGASAGGVPEESPVLQAMRLPAARRYLLTPQGAAAIQAELDRMLEYICQRYHALCAKVLDSRLEVNKKLRLEDFTMLTSEVKGFVTSTEQLSGRTCYELRSTLKNHASAFVEQFHKHRLEKMASLIEIEEWKRIPVPIEVQRRVPGGATEHQPPTATAAGGGTAGAAASGDGNVSDFMFVDGKPYVVVPCTQMAVSIIGEYLECARSLDGLAVDVRPRVTEVVKEFNLRVASMVLRGGAMRTTGAKTISARHLTLASQSVALMAQIVPHLKTYLRALLPENMHVLLNDLDAVQRDLASHAGMLTTKLQDVMRDRVDLFLSRFKEVVWDGPVPHEYMKQTVGEVKKLYDIVAANMAAVEAQAIFHNVFAMIDAKFIEAFGKLSLSRAGQNGLWGDILYYHLLRRKLDGVRDLPGPDVEAFYRSRYGAPPEVSGSATAASGTRAT